MSYYDKAAIIDAAAEQVARFFEPRLIDPRELIGADEVLRICGWKTRKTIGDQRDFPAPVAVVSRMRLWTRTDVERWQEARNSP